MTLATSEAATTDWSTLLERIAAALEDSLDPWGAPFWSTVIATLVGVAVGAVLTWWFSRLLRNAEQQDRYEERFDDRNLLWIDALDAYADRISDEAQEFGDKFYSDEPGIRALVGDRFEPSSKVLNALGTFRTRIRQTALIARGDDLTVLSAIENDVLENRHEATQGNQLDPEYITRMHLLTNSFMQYRRGRLHPSWFRHWSLGTAMPQVYAGDPLKPAPKENPTTQYRKFPPRPYEL